MDNLLPIGSVVYTKDKEHMIVIVGYGGKGSKDIYDYIGFPYPFGFLGKDKILLFNKTNVTEVLFESYKNEEYEEVTKDVSKIIEKARQEASK
jgi:hypothetical protein